MIWSCVPFSDAFRTYDVEVITSIPVTLSRICQGLPQVAEPKAKAIINCEDEPVIGAALGCAIGIMRHPYAGNLPNGQQDFAFPPLTRDVKRSLDEVNRGVLWHRVAPPFRVDGQVKIDAAKLTDTWYFQEREGWATKAGKWSTNSAPAPSRGVDCRCQRSRLPLVNRPLSLPPVIPTVPSPSLRWAGQSAPVPRIGNIGRLWLTSRSRPAK